jgi:hypothetical protein
MEMMTMSGQQQLTNLAVAVEIERFLNGESDGAPLFQALYGSTADEPVPQHLLDIVREGCDPAIEPRAVPVAPPPARRASP